MWDIAIRTASEKNELKSSEDKNNDTERVDETAKPTIALDYTFCRKPKTNSAIVMTNLLIFC